VKTGSDYSSSKRLRIRSKNYGSFIFDLKIAGPVSQHAFAFTRTPILKAVSAKHRFEFTAFGRNGDVPV
jgi:hypothetical protein